MTLNGTPPPEFDVTEALARRLVDSQFPQYVDLPIRAFDRGWDNALYRLGEDLLIRLPIREVGAVLLGSEQTWLPQLASALPLATPLPQHLGVPCEFYPWPWSLVPFFEGACADVADLQASESKVWADFLSALHQPAPKQAPQFSRRGLPLETRRADTDARLQRLARANECVTERTLEAWARGLDAKPSEEHVWLHGDLHGQNILVHEGRLAAVLDWGDMTAGDRASDLSSVWMLFGDHRVREQFWKAYPMDDGDLRARALAWCISVAAVILETGIVDNPRHEALGRMAFANMASEF